MAITNPFSNVFGQSPIKPLQEHMAASVATANELVAFIDATLADDWEAAEAIQKRIGEGEHKADKLKKDLRLHLPKSLFLPVPRSDLLELLTMQDSIANCTKDIAGIMLGRKMVFPTKLHKKVREFVIAAVATAEQALIAINELDKLLETGFSGRELKVVEKLIKELDNLENKTDKLEVTMRASLFKLEAELPPVDVMFLYRVIEWIGELADRSQKVGSRLQLLLAR